MEGHPDNVAACLAGGLTIAWEPAAALRGGAEGSPAGAAGDSPGVARGPARVAGARDDAGASRQAGVRGSRGRGSRA